MKLRMALVLFAISICAMAAARQTAARTIYADNMLAANCASGSYSVGGRNCTGTDGIAFKTIQEATDAVQLGDSVLIRGGTYSEAVTISRSGSAAAPIAIGNFTNETVALNGAKSIPSEASGLISINEAAYIRLSGLKTVNSNYFGIYVSDSSQITIQDCEVSYSNHGGVVATASSNIIVASCEVHHNNDVGLSAWHEAISLEGVDTFEVKNCRVYSNKEEGIDAKYGSTRGSIHHNEVFDNNGPNVYIDAANRIDVFNNTIRSAARHGIGVAVESTSNPQRYTTHDVRVFNNLIYDNACGIWLWVEPGATGFARFENIHIINNVIADNNRQNWGAIFFSNGSPANYGSNLIIRNNILWANTALGGARAIRDDIQTRTRWTIDHNLFQKGESSDTFGQDVVVTAEVKFVDGPNHDYRLRPGSPAIDAGSSVDAPMIDFDGNARPDGSADIGAFEYSADDNPPSPPKNLRPVY
jgi:parallel beta-helix repeat protein